MGSARTVPDMVLQPSVVGASSSKKAQLMEWIRFIETDGQNQQLPKEKREVLLRGSESGMVCVGYLKYRAGVKHDPMFVHVDSNRDMGALEWCDCLPDWVNTDWRYGEYVPRDQTFEYKRWHKNKLIKEQHMYHSNEIVGTTLDDIPQMKFDQRRELLQARKELITDCQHFMDCSKDKGLDLVAVGVDDQNRMAIYDNATAILLATVRRDAWESWLDGYDSGVRKALQVDKSE